MPASKKGGCTELCCSERTTVPTWSRTHVYSSSRAPRLLLTLSLVLLAAGCKKPEAKAELTSAKQELAPISVQTMAASERLMPEHLVLTGTLRASQESE